MNPSLLQSACSSRDGFMLKLGQNKEKVVQGHPCVFTALGVRVDNLRDSEQEVTVFLWQTSDER
jgi:hypothetical protein